MEYLHIKNLEKYHPGYKDRTLQWAKIYFKIAQGDPDAELLGEVDWARLVKFILLELEAQAPIPLDEAYLTRKGFDLKLRPISLTIQMLHNFIDVVTQLSVKGLTDKEKEKDIREEVGNEWFESLWNEYPSKTGKKEALRHFLSSVKTPKDKEDIDVALLNYKDSKRVKGGFILNGSTWFNNWRDWIVSPEPKATQSNGGLPCDAPFPSTY